MPSSAPSRGIEILRMNPSVFDDRDDRLRLPAVLDPFLHGTDHILMRLENDELAVLHPRRRRHFDDDVADRIARRSEAVGRRPGRQPVSDSDLEG